MCVRYCCVQFIVGLRSRAVRPFVKFLVATNANKQFTHCYWDIPVIFGNVVVNVHLLVFEESYVQQPQTDISRGVRSAVHNRMVEYVFVWEEWDTKHRKRLTTLYSMNCMFTFILSGTSGQLVRCVQNRAHRHQKLHRSIFTGSVLCAFCEFLRWMCVYFVRILTVSFAG